jgi:hypothetical protein
LPKSPLCSILKSVNDTFLDVSSSLQNPKRQAINSLIAIAKPQWGEDAKINTSLRPLAIVTLFMYG